MIMDRVTHTLATLIWKQKLWSEKTFGPGHRTKGLIDHIEKELEEIKKEPLDLKEWIDIVILGFDGAWRAGYSARQVAEALLAKYAENEQREWPDWRTAEPDKAIEHIREPRLATVSGDDWRGMSVDQRRAMVMREGATGPGYGYPDRPIAPWETQ